MVMKLNSGFEIIRYSDLSYEEMTVEVQYQGQQLAQINMDKGIDKLEIEIFTEFSDPSFNPKFCLDDFLEAMVKAKEVLVGYKE